MTKCWICRRDRYEGDLAEHMVHRGDNEKNKYGFKFFDNPWSGQKIAICPVCLWIFNIQSCDSVGEWLKDQPIYLRLED